MQKMYGEKTAFISGTKGGSTHQGAEKGREMTLGFTTATETPTRRTKVRSDVIAQPEPLSEGVKKGEGPKLKRRRNENYRRSLPQDSQCISYGKKRGVTNITKNLQGKSADRSLEEE